MDRLQEIFSKALELFIERGYDNTPMSLVARELGLSKAGMYHYFDSKEHLLFLIHMDSIENYLLPQLAKAEAEPDPEKRLVEFMRDYVDVLTRDRSVEVLVHESKRLAPEHYQEIQKAWRRVAHVVSGAIQEMQEQGKALSDLNPTFAAFACIGMCVWSPYWFDRSRPESLEELSDTLTGIFTRGIRAAD